MLNRHERRKASATCRNSKLRTSTLNQHFNETLHRVRAVFERSGEIRPGFECVTDAETFLRIGRTIVPRLPHVQRCGIVFVAAESIDTYSPANLGSAKPLACVQPMMLIAVSPFRCLRSNATATGDTPSPKSCATKGRQGSGSGK